MPSSAESASARRKNKAALDPDYVHPESFETSADSVAAHPRHPSLAADEEVFPLADAGEYYVGLWNGYPKYGCPACAWTCLPKSAAEGDFLTESHILEKAGSSPKHAALVLA